MAMEETRPEENRSDASVEDTSTSDTSAIVEVNPETKKLVEQEMPNATEEIRRETAALFEAIRSRAQAEAQSAGEFTRDAYLNAVRQAREAVEQNKLIDPESIEKSIELVQQEAEKNWQAIARDVEALGNRLSEAAKAAWEKLFPHDEDSSQHGK
jgi:hypothetical protein